MKMKCHYEVLNVGRDADDGEIKSAYRKLALKWHPDKNLENNEFAKEQFQLVQQAYEVLSDKHERAWYDRHREQILCGSNSDFQDNSLDVFQYFCSCFKGYGDDEDGFYAIYRNVFEKVAKEDMDFMEDKEEFCQIPSFGNSQTDYENVAKFYAFWSNYATKKSYVWLDPYNVTDIRDRRYLKAVEKENKKVRQQAKKERNEEIRNLVAFVKKRDKRVQDQKKQLEQKQLDNKKKREQLKRQKKLARMEELNNSSEQPEWAKFDNFKSELEDLEKNLAEEFGDFSNSEDDFVENINNLYCIACNKLFKTPKAFENHESSKKHKENVDILKNVLLTEENNKLEENGASYCSNDLSDFDNENLIDQELINPKDDETESDTEELEEIFKLKQKKKQKNVISVSEPDDIGDILIDKPYDTANDFTSISKKQKKAKRKGNNKSEKEQIVSCKIEEESEIMEDKPHRSKKERKNKNDSAQMNDIDLAHNCLTCKSNFPSKNKLFDHLKKTGHGVYINQNTKNKSRKNLKVN